MSTTYQWDVFLSHSSNDKPAVRMLATQLRDAGLRVWFDEWAIQPGADIYAAVEDGLERSRTLVLCMSRAAFGSDWVRLERGTAIFRDPQNRSRRFIPLLLDDCNIPDTIRRFLYIDYRSSSAAARASLIDACKQPALTTTVDHPTVPSFSPDQELPGARDSITSIAVSRDARYIATGYRDGLVCLWDAPKAKLQLQHSTFASSVTSCHFTAANTILISGAEGIRDLDLLGAIVGSYLKGQNVPIMKVTHSGKGFVALADAARLSLQYGRIHQNSSIKNLTLRSSIRALDTFANTDLLAIATRDGIYALRFDMRSMAARPLGEGDNILSLACSPKGRLVVTGHADSTVQVLDTSTMERIGTFEGHNGPVTAVAIHPNGTLAASCEGPTETRRWNIHTGECLGRLPDAGGSIAFSGDGSLFVAAMRLNHLGLWRLRGGRIAK